MAFNVGEVVATLGLDTGDFESGLSTALDSIGRFGSLAAAAGLGVGGLIGIAIADGINSKVIPAMRDMFDEAAIFEQTRMAFSTMFGDVADDFYDELQRFGVETPFELPELESAAKQLKAYGFSTEDIIPILTAAGDAAAAMGDPGVIDRVTRALGQMQSKGKVMAEEMNRQLIEAGIPAWDYLAEAMGISTEEVQRLTEQGLIPADEAIAAIIKGIEDGDMGGMMADQMDTANGKLAMFEDNILLLKRDLGEPLVEAFKPFLDLAADGLERLSGKVEEWTTEYGPMFEAVWEDLQPILEGIVRFGFNTLIRVLDWLIPRVIITAAVMVRLYQKFETAVSKVREFKTSVETAFSKVSTAVYNGVVSVRGYIITYLIDPLNDALALFEKLSRTDLGRISLPSMPQKSSVGKAKSIPKAASGGILTGPKSGYLAMLHGTEVVTPISKVGTMGHTFNFYNTSRSDIPHIEAAVRKVLRDDVRGASLAYGGI